MDKLDVVIQAYDTLIKGIESDARLESQHRAYGGIIRSGKGKLVENITEIIIRYAWDQLGGHPSRINFEKKIDFFKIDVQGSEIDIINGGLDIIKEAKGILMEVSLMEYNQNAPTKDFVYEYMDNLGFKPVELIGNINHPLTYELIQQDILFLNKKYDNTLAI